MLALWLLKSLTALRFRAEKMSRDPSQTMRQKGGREAGDGRVVGFSL